MSELSHVQLTDTEKSGGLKSGGYDGYDGSPLRHTITTDTQRAFPVYHRKLANPAPLGLFGFASTTLILSLYNAGARGITVFATGNTFGATAFSMYGGFWLSFGAIYWPGSGILDAYQGAAKSQLSSALGIYLITWMIITLLFFFATFRSSIALVGVFFFLTLTFMALAIGEFAESINAHKAGGVLGVITALVAFYTGSAGLYTADAGYFVLPVGDLPKNRLA